VKLNFKDDITATEENTSTKDKSQKHVTPTNRRYSSDATTDTS